MNKYIEKMHTEIRAKHEKEIMPLIGKTTDECGTVLLQCLQEIYAIIGTAYAEENEPKGEK